MRLAFGVAIAVMWGATGAGAQPLAASSLLPPADEAALKNAAFAWQSTEVALPSDASVRVDVAQPLRTPAGVIDPKAYNITLSRAWPAAVSLETNRFQVDVSPHAGFGFGKSGTSAQAGARVELSRHPRQDKAVERLKDMGVKEGSHFGAAGRWYMFAAADGRAVGLNVMHGEGGWDRAGWTTDATGALVGDAQIGVGWRKGDAQSSFGVIHREVRGNHMMFAQGTKQDTVAAFTFSIKPSR